MGCHVGTRFFGLPSFFTPAPEKRGNHIGTGIGQQTAFYIGMMVQPIFGKEIHDTATGTRFRFDSAIHNARNTGMLYRTGAHGTGLNRHV
jgi:hypothetical protein